MQRRAIAPGIGCRLRCAVPRPLPHTFSAQFRPSDAYPARSMAETTHTISGDRMDQRKYATLLSVAQEAAAGREDNARALLARLVDEQLEGDARGTDLHAYIFATALSRRLN